MRPGPLATAATAEGLREALAESRPPGVLERSRRVLELDRPGDDAAQIGQNVLDIALTLAEAEAGGLWIRRARQPTLEILAVRSQELGRGLASTLSARVVQRRLPTLPVACPPHPIGPVRALLRASSWKWAVLVPIEAETLSGLLAVGGRTDAHPHPASLASPLARFARLAAIPLTGALLREELEQRVRQLRAVRRLGTAVAEGATLEELFRIVGRELEGLLSFDLAALVVAESWPETGIVLMGERGKPARRLDWSAAWAETLRTLVRRSPQRLVVTDLSRKTKRLHPFARAYPRGRALLSASFHLDDGAAGTLLLVSGTPGRFDDHAARLVEPIVGVLAAGVGHTRGPSAVTGGPRDGGRAGQQLGESDQDEIGRLAGALAHRIRNPLTVIGITLQCLRNRELPDVEDRLLLEAAEGKVHEIDEAVEGFLSLSRPLALRPEPTVVGALLTEVAEFIRARAEAQAVEVQVDAEAGLPAAMIDRRYLGQALLTLALEALEAMPTGGRLVLAARPATDVGQVLLRVVDTGDGLESRDRDAGGRDEAHDPGLALAITRRLVEAQGGTLQAHRDPTGGATFALSLPAVA